MTSNNPAISINATAADYIVEAGMLRASGKLAVVFVEGDSDRRLYSALFKRDVAVIPANNFSNVEEIIDAYTSNPNNALPKIVGIVDRDYRVAAGEVKPNNDLICTEFRDIECEMVDSVAFDNVIDEFSSQKLRSAWPTPTLFKKIVLDAASEVGKIRLYNHATKSNIDFKGINYSKIQDFTTHKLSGDELIKQLRGAQKSGGKCPANFGVVSKFVANKKFFKHQSSLRLSRGHDVFEIVAFYLKKGYGRKGLEIDAEMLESSLRIGFKPIIRSSPTVKKVIAWFNQQNLQASIQ